MPTAFPSVSSVPQTLPLISRTGSEVVDKDSVETDQFEVIQANQGHSLSESVHNQSQVANPPTRRESASKIYHRIAEVRAQQGLSLRTISRRTGLDVKELKRQEVPTCNLSLSQVLVWQKALEVPLVDLLEDESEVLSRPVKERAQMVRIMKTVVSLGEVCQGNVRLGRLTTMLREQILQLMPELAEIGGWPQCGSRRGSDVMGRLFHEPVRVEFDGD